MSERKPFITTWKTTESNQKVVMPLYTTNGRYQIDWGDNTLEVGTAALTHTYAKPGTYKVIIEDISNSEDASFWINFRSVYSSRNNIQSVDQWGTIKWKTMNSAFSNCTSLTIKATDAPDLSIVKDMGSMFVSSSAISNPDLTSWDVSNVTSMANMFVKSNFNGDISSWDVSNVTYMQSMFRESSFNGDISKWDVSNVISMANMFVKSNFNGDISKWDVSNVTSMTAMFSQSQFNEDISSWDVSNVTSMGAMFNQSSFNGDIGSWDVSKVIHMSSMFSGSPFNGDISSWNVSKVNYMISMFYQSPFNGDISKWDVSNVTHMQSMFRESPFNSDISSWDVSKVTDMKHMFLNSPFNGNISKWDVSKVTDMSHMFAGSPFNGDISSWDVSNVTDMSHMFVDSPFNGDISSWDVSKVSTMYYMFLRATSFNQNISGWNVSNVINLEGMFNKATSFKGNIGTWKIHKVETMSKIFEGVKLSREAYDEILTNWSQLEAIQKNVIFDAPLSNYCFASAARDTLINTHQWDITDAGQACDDLIDLGQSEIKALPANVILSNNAEANFSKIIIKAKDKNGNFLNTGGRNISIKASMGTVSAVIDHRNGTYSANLSASQKGTSQVSFYVNGKNAGKTILVSFIESKGCKLPFNIEADQRIIEAKGRYRKVSDKEWVYFTITNPQTPTTPLIEDAGLYELQTQVMGVSKKWTAWYPNLPLEFGVNTCKLEGIPIKINKGKCWDLSYDDMVFVNPESITYNVYDEIQIKEGVILYLDSTLKVTYNGNNNVFTYNYWHFKIDENGKLSDLGFCDT